VRIGAARQAGLTNRQGPWSRHAPGLSRPRDLPGPWTGRGIWPLHTPQKVPGSQAESREMANISERDGGTDAWPALLQGHQNR